MTIKFFWRLPTSGDGRYGAAAQQRRGERSVPGSVFSAGVSDPRSNRFNYFDYIHQVARAADLSGFDGIQIPNDPHGDESWIVAGYVARSTRHLTLLTEFDASRGSAVYAAKNAASYQRFSGGRFAWQISVNESSLQRRQDGDYIYDSDTYPRIEEFIAVACGVLTTSPFSFRGRFFEVQDGGFRGPLANQKVPPIYLSGNTTAAYRLSAKSADVHVLQALPVNDLKPAIITLNGLAGEQARPLGLGLRIDILARETEEEAFFDAHRFLEQLGQQQRNVIASADNPNLWRGLSTDQTGATASLVGSYDQVAAIITEYVNAGIRNFILAAAPHFEEAYRVGEYVLPLVHSLTPASSARKRVA